MNHIASIRVSAPASSRANNSSKLGARLRRTPESERSAAEQALKTIMSSSLASQVHMLQVHGDLLVLDLSGTPNGISAGSMIKTMLLAAGFAVTIGVGRNEWLAHTARRLSGDTRESFALQMIWQEAVLFPDRFVEHVPVELLPISSESRERLVGIGYRFVSELRAWSLSELAEFMGREGAAVYRCVHGIDQPIRYASSRRVQPSLKVSERRQASSRYCNTGRSTAA